MLKLVRYLITQNNQLKKISLNIILCKNDKTKIQREGKYLILLLLRKSQTVILVKIKNKHLLVLKIIKKRSNSTIKETMLSYCLVCKKNTENNDAKVIKIKNNANDKMCYL